MEGAGRYLLAGLSIGVPRHAVNEVGYIVLVDSVSIVLVCRSVHVSWSGGETNSMAPGGGFGGRLHQDGLSPPCLVASLMGYPEVAPGTDPFDSCRGRISWCVM